MSQDTSNKKRGEWMMGEKWTRSLLKSILNWIDGMRESQNELPAAPMTYLPNRGRGWRGWCSGFLAPLEFPFPLGADAQYQRLLVFASTQGLRNAFHLHCRKETDKGNASDESFVNWEDNKIVIWDMRRNGHRWRRQTNSWSLKSLVERTVDQLL